MADATQPADSGVSKIQPTKPVQASRFIENLPSLDDSSPADDLADENIDAFLSPDPSPPLAPSSRRFSLNFRARSPSPARKQTPYRPPLVPLSSDVVRPRMRTRCQSNRGIEPMAHPRLVIFDSSPPDSALVFPSIPSASDMSSLAARSSSPVHLHDKLSSNIVARLLSWRQHHRHHPNNSSLSFSQSTTSSTTSSALVWTSPAFTSDGRPRRRMSLMSSLVRAR